MIEIHDLSKTYEAMMALDSLTLSVRGGEILGFLGPNGAGKTTTVKILTGMIHADKGSANVAGFDIQTQPLEVKQRIGYVPENGAMYQSLTAGEYLDFVANLYHVAPAVAKQRRKEFLDLFGIADMADKRMTEFSKGMKQKVLITSALLHRPDVLFMDEPLNGLDANAAMIVKELLKGFAAQGKTIFFCSHILEVVERMCTRIVVINHGRKIADGTAQLLIAESGTSSLEEAFSSLTGVRNAGETTRAFLSGLENS